LALVSRIEKIRRRRVLGEQRCGCMIWPHWQKPHCGTFMFAPGFLRRMHAVAVEAFDGGHLQPGRRRHRQLAGANRQ